MADPTEHSGEHHAEHGHHDDGFYLKIYLTLLVLLVISVAGPFLEILWVTLITAFGIAIVKATLVVRHFMHLSIEKTIAKWVLAVSLVLMGLFFFGVAPDVMKHTGTRWVNVAAIAAVERGIPLEGEEHGEEEAAHEDEPGDGEPDPGGAAEAVAVAFEPANAYTTTCALCHGAAGGGDGVGGAALDPPPADFTDPATWAASNDERMFNVIKNGGGAEGLSAGMAAWGALYSDEEIRQLVEHLKTFRP